MTKQMVKAHGAGGGWLRRLIGRFGRGEKGAISPLMAMALVPIIGAMALGTEATNWWLLQRQAQNAADSAAIAAANAGSVNGISTCGTTGDYCAEAYGVTKSYGFVNGANSTTVTVLASQACPSPLTATDCFKVNISRIVPVTLLSIVGFQGTQGGGNQKIAASAMAYATGAGNNTTYNFCVIALGTAVTKDLTINGGPNSALPNCNIGSNGGTICNGHSISGVAASYAAPGDTNDCADSSADDLTLRAPIKDPYTGDATNIPTNPCSTYAQESHQNQVSSLPTANQITGTLSGTTVICGDAGLTGNVTLQSGAILMVVNGWLDLGSFNLTGTGASGATIIFAGTASSNPFGTDKKGNPIPANPPYVTGNTGSTLTINAPTSGTWDGFAVYTDPRASNVPAASFSVDGNSPTYAMNGLFYSPNASVTISGTVGSNSTCIGFLVDTFIVNGTGNIIDQPNCAVIPLTGSNEGFLAGVVELVK
jgi:hypothetical protein